MGCLPRIAHCLRMRPSLLPEQSAVALLKPPEKQGKCSNASEIIFTGGHRTGIEMWWLHMGGKPLVLVLAFLICKECSNLL